MRDLVLYLSLSSDLKRDFFSSSVQLNDNKESRDYADTHRRLQCACHSPPGRYKLCCDFNRVPLSFYKYIYLSIDV